MAKKTKSSNNKPLISFGPTNSSSPVLQGAIIFIIVGAMGLMYIVGTMRAGM